MPGANSLLNSLGPSDGSKTQIEPHSPKDLVTTEIKQTDVETRLPLAEIREVSEQFSMIEISGNCAKRLAEIGAGLDSMGSVQVANGGLLVTTKTAIKWMIRVDEVLTNAKTDTLLKAGKPIAQVLNAVNKSMNSLKNRVPTNSKPAPGPTRTPSFPADQPVQMLTQTQINIHTKEES